MTHTHTHTHTYTHASRYFLIASIICISSSSSSSFCKVLMGRGGKNNQHSGNEKLRGFARKVCEKYKASTKKGKSNISRELVLKVREQNPPGRYVTSYVSSSYLINEKSKLLLFVPVGKITFSCSKRKIYMIYLLLFRTFSFTYCRFLKRDQGTGKWEDVGDDVGTFSYRRMFMLRNEVAVKSDKYISHNTSSYFDHVSLCSTHFFHQNLFQQLGKKLVKS